MKLRSDHVRALRARGLAVMFGVLFGTLFTFYVLWRSADWTLDRLIYKNRAFAIRTIELSTDGHIAVEYLQRWSGAKPGQNLMAIDLADVKGNLELLPNIEAVTVERVLPSKLRIRVVERKPVARVQLPRFGEQKQLVIQQWLLASDGTVTMPVNPKYCSSEPVPPVSELPLLTGIRSNELQLGRAMEASRVHVALAFVQSFAQSGLGTWVQLKTIDLSKPGVVVTTTTDGARVTLGPDNFERQLARWRAIHQVGLQQRKRILTMDLAVRNNVPVQWVEAQEPVTGRSMG